MPLPSTAVSFGNADIPALMADMGIAVTVGGVNGIGLLDEADEVTIQDAERGQVVVTMTTITVRTSDFPAVAIDTVVSVGSTNFIVRERLKIGDGGLTKLLLGKSSGVSVAGGGTVYTGPIKRHFPVSGAIDGVNTTFVFSPVPGDPSAFFLIWNGLVVDPSEYTLTGGTVVTTGFVPHVSDMLYALY